MPKSVAQIMVLPQHEKRILCAAGIIKAHKLTIDEDRTLKTKEGMTGDTPFDLI